MSCASVTGVQTYALPIATTRVGRALVTSLRNASVAVSGIVASPCCSPRPAAPSRRHCRFGLPGSPLVGAAAHGLGTQRSEEHTSELQSLMRISYAVFCLKKKNITITQQNKLQTAY